MDRKSISGFAVLLDGGAISWGSKKQTSVSLSTVEAEFIAALYHKWSLTICDGCFDTLKSSKMRS